MELNSENDISDSDDDFNEEEKLLLQRKSNRIENFDDKDAVLGFDSEDDEIDDDGAEDEEMSDIDMGSDIEDRDEKLPDDRAWGQKRKSFYNTDYVDQDYAGAYEAEEAEAAAMEEEEARNIQKRLMQQLSDADFSLGDIAESTLGIPAGEKPEAIETDLSKLTKRQKLELFHKESPEFANLVNDFISKITEAREKIIPVLNLLEEGKLKPSSASKFLEIKLRIILNYCTNIGFYLLLKTKRIPVHDHPVLKSLLRYRQLLIQLQPTYESVVAPQVDKILEMFSTSEEPEVKQKQLKKKKAKKMLNILKKTMSKKSKSNPVVSEVPTELGTIPSEGEEDEGDKEDDDESDHDKTEISKQEKRAITYEMAKNKGLTPKRSKEQRNPRVKHRNKFRKAKIRRRGQVRTARKEIPVYGGEPTGIKIGLKKGIKLK